MSEQSDLLQAILHLNARQVFPPDELLKSVSPKKAEKYVNAYNLCDGSRTQGEIAAEAGIDPGNFSKIVSKWNELGICYRIGDGNEARLVHAYPVTEMSKEE